MWAWMCEPSPGVAPGLLPGHPCIAMTLLSPGSLFTVHVTPQVPSSEVGQAWAAAGACRAVTSRWDVSGFLWAARVGPVAAVLLWGGSACPRCQALSLASHQLGSGGGRLSFFFKSLVIVAGGDRCHGCFESLNLLCC